MKIIQIQKNIHKILLAILIAGSFVFVTLIYAAPLTAPADITSCGDELTTAGIYTLQNNITGEGTCLTVTADGVIIDGQGLHTITGNINANGNSEFASGHGYSFTMLDVTVDGSITSNGEEDIIGDFCPNGENGNGGNIILTNTIINGNVSSNGANDVSCTWLGGNGGDILFSSSTHSGTITANGGTPSGLQGSITDFAAGDGTELDPYQITNWTGLNGMRYDLAAYYVLNNNISSTTNDYIGIGNGWVPIGNYSSFTGNFNGDNYTIEGLVMNLPSTSGVGLFKNITGSISNIGLTNVSIIGQYNTGSLAGSQYGGSITNSYSTGSMGGYSTTGGLVGFQSGSSSIANSYSIAGVNGSFYTGGLVGSQGSGSSVTNSYSAGSVNGGVFSAGGLVGFQNDGSIINSYSTGNVTGNGNVGGLAGSQYGGSSITNSYSTGSMGGNNYVGGLVGYQSEGSITNSYSTRSVYGYNNAGGLVGFQGSGSITNSFFNKISPGQIVMCGYDSNAGFGGCNNNYGLISIEMQSILPFILYSWDIGFGSDLNSGFPYLAWQADENSYTWFSPSTINVWTNNANDGNWNNSENWTKGSVPINSEEIALIDDVTLPGNITNNITIVGNNVTVNGANFTITGNVVGYDSPVIRATNLDRSGYSFTLEDVTVIGDVISYGQDNSVIGGHAGNGGTITIMDSIVQGNIIANGGQDITGGYYYPGSGGTVSLTNSTSTTIYANGGDTIANLNSSIGGNGGIVNITSSIFDIIEAKGGTFDIAYGNSDGGAGGTATIIGSTVDLTDSIVTLSGEEGADGFVDGTNGNINLTYTDIDTNVSTFFYDIGDLIINEFSYGSWNGVFNPQPYYFDDMNTSDGDWNNPLNWWSDSDRLILASVPEGFNDVIVYSDITDNIGGSDPLYIHSIIFNNGASNYVPMTVYSGIVFNNGGINFANITGQTVFNGTSTNNANITGTSTYNGLSINNGTTTGVTFFSNSAQNNGRIVNDAMTTFYGNLSSSTGLVTNTQGATSSPITRIFTENVTTVRNFLTEAGHNNWIVVAQEAIVDISNAVYSTVTNIFKALRGGSFLTGLNPSVVPQLEVNLPTNGQIITKWLPDITWDTGSICEYKIDNGDYIALDCNAAGADLPKPSANSHILYVRATDSNGNISETDGISFTYDNTVPIYTTCGDDLLDEVTRPYYYLQSDITGDCRATVNTKLYGNVTPNNSVNNGFTLTGNIIATTTGNGLDITLKNIIVTGTTTNSGASNIGAGFNAGTLTISTSTVGAIVSEGGDGTTHGGNGGIILITNTLESAVDTPILAKGGDATMCGFGGNGGSVILTNSTFTGTVSVNPGLDQIVQGAGLCAVDAPPPSGSSGAGGTANVVGTYTPLSQNPNQTPIQTPIFTQFSAGGTVSLAIKQIGNLTLPELPTFDLGIKNPFDGLKPYTPVFGPLEKIVQNTSDIFNSATSKTVQTVGFFAGIVAALSLYINTLFASPLLLSEILLIPVRLWGLILKGLGLRKNAQPWGTVYDSVTKRPIDPAFVTARDEANNIVAESMTDIDGRYGFLLPDGKYHISVQKSNYEFPSKKMIDRISDELYNDIYHGEEVTIKAGEVIGKNIPMDQLNYDWNEEIKKNENLNVFHKKYEKPFRVIGNYIFRIGLLISIVSSIFNPTTYNIIIIIVYLIIYGTSHLGLKSKRLGYIKYKGTNKPLPYAIFRVTTLDHQTVLRSGVCDAQGRYYCIVPKGQYYLDIDKKNPDGTYTRVYESDVLSGNHGIINRDFAI